MSWLKTRSEFPDELQTEFWADGTHKFTEYSTTSGAVCWSNSESGAGIGMVRGSLDSTDNAEVDSDPLNYSITARGTFSSSLFACLSLGWRLGIPDNDCVKEFIPSIPFCFYLPMLGFRWIGYVPKFRWMGGGSVRLFPSADRIWASFRRLQVWLDSQPRTKISLGGILWRLYTRRVK